MIVFTGINHYMKPIHILLFMALAISCSAHAEIYKWTDDAGNVHYGDKPVKNSSQLEINAETANSVGEIKESREERRRRLLDAMQEDREEKDKQKAEREKKQNKLNRQCTIAKDRLQTYERSSSLYNLDKNGNRITLSDEERKKATDKLRSQIKKYCK